VHRETFAVATALLDVHLDSEVVAALAVVEADLVLLLERAKQVACVLEGDLRALVEAQESLVSFAERLAEAQLLDRAGRCGRLAPEKAEDAKEGGESRGFAPDAGIPHEERALARALAAMPPHVAAGAVGDVRPIELADAVVGEAGPAADRARARLVPDQAQGQVEPQAIARVSVVGNANVSCLDASICRW